MQKKQKIAMLMALIFCVLMGSILTINVQPAFGSGVIDEDWQDFAWDYGYHDDSGNLHLFAARRVDDAGRAWDQCSKIVYIDGTVKYFVNNVMVEEKLADGTTTFYNTDGTLAEKNKYTVHYLVNSTEVDAETYEYNETFTVAAPNQYKTADTTDYTYSISTEWETYWVSNRYNIESTIASGATCRMPYKDIYLYATETKTLKVSKTFSDVSKTAWYYEYVTRAVNHGLLNGYGNSNKFGPDDSLTRAQLAVILYNYFGDGNTTGTKNTTGLSDVSANQWYTAAANWAVKNGIISGMSGKFAPNNTATREQVCVIIERTAKKFCNANISNVSRTRMEALQANGNGAVSSWAEESVAWCINNGILTGMDGKYIAASQPVTRAQIASMMMRAIDANIFYN